MPHDRSTTLVYTDKCVARSLCHSRATCFTFLIKGKLGQCHKLLTPNKNKPKNEKRKTLCGSPQFRRSYDKLTTCRSMTVSLNLVGNSHKFSRPNSFRIYGDNWNSSIWQPNTFYCEKEYLWEMFTINLKGCGFCIHDAGLRLCWHFSFFWKTLWLNA